MILLSLTLLLHLIVQYIIKRKRLHDNQYHLIRVLSASDSVVVLISCAVIVLSLTQYSMSREIPVLLSLLAMIGLTFSLVVTLVIAIDRLIAVKYCLQYHSLVTRMRIHLVLLISGILNAALLSCLYYVWKVTKTAVSRYHYSNLGALIYLTVTRAICCISLTIIGKITIYIRNQSEIELKKRTNLHGRDAEKLDRTKHLKRGIKDVFQLNFWTCIFLLPMAITAVLTFLDFISQERVFFISVLATSAYTLSNPIIYLTCFSKIRKFWLPMFTRISAQSRQD